MQVVSDTAEIFGTYEIETQIIAASIRHLLHITQAALAGADIATVPYSVLMKALRHPLTEAGVELVEAAGEARRVRNLAAAGPGCRGNRNQRG